MKSIVLILSGMAVIAAIIIFSINLAHSEKGSEIVVRDYQGDKLDDLSAFRENSIKGVQYVEEESYLLRVGGLVKKPLEFTYAELQDIRHIEKLVTLHCVEGWTAKILWKGISLIDLIEAVDPDEGAKNLIFRSADGYTTSLSLDFVRERNIIIADRINGIKLPPAQGFPFIVVAEDKRGYKWARWIEEIELSEDTTFRGYWESRGYNNDGDLQKPMFE